MKIGKKHKVKLVEELLKFHLIIKNILINLQNKELLN